MLDRREFLKLGLATGAALTTPLAWRTPAGWAATRLSGAAYGPKFAAPLRRPLRVDLTSTAPTQQVDIVQFEQQVLTGYPATTLYGYEFPHATASWPGPTIVARADATVKVHWRNRLPRGRSTLAESHLLPVDLTTHLAMPYKTLPQGNIPVVTHLHGGHTESASDGLPDAWFTQNQSQKGPGWSGSMYSYDNTQRGATLWYHDHAIGITRLNVYAGLAGLYLLRDGREEQLMKSGVLPDERFEVELLLQDRWFTDDGQLFLDTAAPPDGGILPSLFADFVLVNGTPWPVLDVEPRSYRLRLLNGSDSRFFVLTFADSRLPLLQVGTELGLVERAVALERLVIAPGERYDVVVDFSAVAGQEVILRNVGVDGVLIGFRDAAGAVTNDPNDTAFTFGPPRLANPNSTGRVMAFRVAATASSAPRATVTAGTRVGDPMPTLTPTNTRRLITFNGRDHLGRFMEMQGTLADGTLMWDDPVTETIALGAVEIWEIYNTGPIAHPIHLHLVDLQVLDRQRFTFTSTPKDMVQPDGAMGTGALISNIATVGARRPAGPHERGPKDIAICYPNEVTRVIARFDRRGRYVWHCHILHHEDHEMMRPFVVG